MDAHLLRYLQRPRATSSLPAVEALIEHHLAHASPPKPTPLAASIISSPIWHPLSNDTLASISTSFRRATHLRLKLLDGDSGVFTRSVRARMAEWVQAVLAGFSGGHPALKLASCGGLLIGLEDLKDRLTDRAGRATVEDEVVVSAAEVFESTALSPSWGMEFQKTGSGEDILTLALVQAANSFPLVSSQKLYVLDLASLAERCTSAIESAFDHGSFLSAASSSVAQDEAGALSISPISVLAQTASGLLSTSVFQALGRLSKLTALSVSLLGDSPSPNHQAQAWQFITRLCDGLYSITQRVENDWVTCPLSRISSDADISPATREVTTQVWTLLKTLLFTTLLLSQSILSVLRFLPPPRFSSQTPFTAPYLSKSILQSLSHMSFVISHFGGVSASSSQGGFTELKSTFFAALDVLAHDKVRSAAFIHDMRARCDFGDSTDSSFAQAKMAYILACAEQLVPVLTDAQIKEDVLPLCLSHLSDAAHRETYESAHSVVLALFASSMHRPKQERRDSNPSLAERLVPFYAYCLIENSADGKLSTDQLRLAYAAVVRFASEGCSSEANAETALATMCIDWLLSALSPPSPPPLSAAHMERLQLTLVSLLPSVPPVLLPRLLSEILLAIQHAPDVERKQVLVNAAYVEIMERVGDAGKELVMKWWHEDARRAVDGNRGKEAGTTESEPTEVRKRPGEAEFHSRL